MKRAEALQPLSRDHLHALNAAMLLKRADDANVDEAISEMSDFWEPRGRRHFETEEELFVTGLLEGDEEWASAVQRINSEHDAIRTRLGELPASTGADRVRLAHELGELLNDHVRFEDREAFVLLEERADAATLAELGTRIEAS